MSKNISVDSGITALDKISVFDGLNFKAWMRQLQLVFMANNLLEVMDDSNKPVPKVKAAPDADERKEAANWSRMSQKAVALISLCVSPAISALLDSNFKVKKTTNGIVETKSYSISATISSKKKSTRGTSTTEAATPALMLDYLWAQYGQTSLMDTFLMFKRVWGIKIPSSGNPAPSMNQIDACVNELATENVEIPAFIHAMILINALPPNYNMATFLANVVNPADLRPNAVRTTVQAMYVNSPALTSRCDGGDRRDNNIAAKISAVPRKPAYDLQFRSQHAPGAPYASGSGSGNHPDRHNNNGRGRGNGRGGRGGARGRGGAKRQDKGKGREHNAHAAADSHFAAHTVEVPSLLDRISDAPADKLSSEDYDLLKAEVAAGRTRFGVAPGSADEFDLRRMARRHIVERRMALTAEPSRNTLFAAKSPVSAAIPSVLIPEFRVQHALTRRQRKERKLAQMVGTDRLGAPSSLTGTYRDHRAANDVSDARAALAARIDASYRLDYEADSSDDDSLSEEVSEDWLNNPEPDLCTTASGARLLSRFVSPPPASSAGDVSSGSSSSRSPKCRAEPTPATRSKRVKRPRVVEEVAAVSVCLSSDSAYS
jgi:hypothetical protein